MSSIHMTHGSAGIAINMDSTATGMYCQVLFNAATLKTFNGNPKSVDNRHRVYSFKVDCEPFRPTVRAYDAVQRCVMLRWLALDHRRMPSDLKNAKAIIDRTIRDVLAIYHDTEIVLELCADTAKPNHLNQIHFIRKAMATILTPDACLMMCSPDIVPNEHLRALAEDMAAKLKCGCNSKPTFRML